MKNLISQKQFLSPLAKLPCLLLLVAMLALTGCQTDQFDASQSIAGVPKQFQADALTLREGDTLNISFPGSTTLDTTQQIRPDGKIVLPLIGEVAAAGKAPEALQNELLKMYQPQATVKQVMVSVQSPTIPIYVTGAVLRPGPIAVNHPISVLDAVMEAGGFDYTKANLKGVVIVRQQTDRTVRYKLNLKKVLSGSEGGPFYLKPYDIVYVPERFTWF
ncbi:MAG TPA: polysaccharide biosynthesis/export family protein [Verrucomicrobiae bacterium]|jgi:polysaccharide export outer membrane protein